MYIKRSHHPAAAADYAACYDPGTLTALAVIGTVTSAVGAIRQGKALKAQADLQAGVLEQEAANTRDRAQDAERDYRRARDFDLASLRAAGGGTGVIQTAGSSLLGRDAFTREAELQALRIRAGGETAATRSLQQAQLQEFQGRAAQKAGFFRAGSLLTSGLSKVDFSKP